MTDTRIPTARLGTDGPEVGVQGLGCMGMSFAYGPTDGKESRATLERALELGVTLYDTADAYGAGENERFLAPFFRAHRDELVIATNLRRRIETLRSQEQSAPASRPRPYQATTATVIHTLTESLRGERATHRERIRELEQRLAAAHGEILRLRRSASADSTTGDRLRCRDTENVDHATVGQHAEPHR